jgi:hypothetical protein
LSLLHIVYTVYSAFYPIDEGKIAGGMKLTIHLKLWRSGDNFALSGQILGFQRLGFTALN